MKQNNTKIILIRHGQSLGNASKVFLGHTDMDLTEQGYIQAQTTAEYLKNEKIDVIYSSDLIRAYNTAVPHAKIRNIDVKTSKNLREMYVGAWENCKLEDILAKWGREMFINEWQNNFGLFTFPEGESIKDGGFRFYNEVLSIAKANIGKTILICAHAAVIRSFWSIINHVEWSDLVSKVPFPTNASFSIAYFDGNDIIPDIYSFDSHLSEVGVTKVIHI